MSMFRPMRDDLSKYRKRKTVPTDGSVPGVPYTDYRKSRHYVSGMPSGLNMPNQQHDSYNWRNPREYHPNINAPASQSPDYEPNENWQSHKISHQTDPRLFLPFPELPVQQEEITYDNSKAAGEFFLKIQEAMYKPFEEGREIPSLADIWHEHFSGIPEDVRGPDISNLESAPEPAAELSAEDIGARLNNIAGALNHLQKVFPEDHPDIINLRGPCMRY